MALGQEPKKRRRRRRNNEPQTAVEPHELITSSEVEQIRQSLIQTNADLVVRGMLDYDVRAELEKIVRRDFNSHVKGNDAVIKYVVRETIGTGVIEEILQDESITDVGYNGKELIIESNDNKQVFESNFEITEDYILRLVNKFANANDKEFTSKNPVFDGRFENVRINAVHGQNTAPESGTTMALRVVRPRLALTEDNFEGFAPMFVLDFFKAAAISRANMVISGTTGTGKTELHKLISGFVPFEDRILLIEDTPETFMKEMFPEKDIYSWVTSENVGVTELIKAGLRNHPAWIMVTETRGSEAYEMIQAVLSGHSIITSLHATDARAIPSRFVNMAKMGYQLEEAALIDDIRRYFHFGIHIRKVKYHGKVIRYLNEIVEFNPDGDRTVFRQRFANGVFYYETFGFSDEFIDMLEESMVYYMNSEARQRGVFTDEEQRKIDDSTFVFDFPENIKSERILDADTGTYETVIPLDDKGRPDYAKIRQDESFAGVIQNRDGSEQLDEDDAFKEVPSTSSQEETKEEQAEEQQEENKELSFDELKRQAEERISRRKNDSNNNSTNVTDNDGKTDEERDEETQRVIEREARRKKKPQRPRQKPRRPKREDSPKSIQDLVEEKRRKLNQ